MWRLPVILSILGKIECKTAVATAWIFAGPPRPF